MPNESPNKSLLQTILTMIDTMAHEGNGYDNLINILSLLCLTSILSRLQPPTTAPTLQSSQSPTASNAATNPLQKILGDLTKNMDGSGGGPSPDMLMSLLPLLNNPQVKSKLNPANISNILGLMNNFGGSTNNEKPDTSKHEKAEKKESPAAAVTPALADQPPPPTPSDAKDQDKKDLGRSLNWKTNFQNEKEV
jgi:hypothetical protein